MNKFLSFTTALCVVLSMNAAAKIWRVNNNIGVQADFTTPNGAVAAASPGDTIHIEASASAYSDGMTINKRLVVRGPGYFLNEATPNPKTQHLKMSAVVSGLTLNMGSKGSIIEGLNVNNNTLMSDSFITVQRCYLTNVYPAYGHNVISDTVRNNYIAGGIYVNSANYKGYNLIFYNNIITGTISITATATTNFNGYFINNSFINASNYECSNFIFQNNIFNNPNFSSYVLANTFVNNIASNSGIPSGNNNQLNVSMADVYNGWSSGTGFSTDGRYKLKAGSPAIGAGVLGGNAVDCGAFGGPAPYILSGMPAMPSIYEVTMPTQVNSGTSAINITVSAAAH